MGTRRDFTNQTINGFTFLRPTGKQRPGNGNVYWLVKCLKCNSEKEIVADAIVGGRYKSCGCTRYNYAKTIKNNLLNQKFNKLTCIKYVGRKGKKSRHTYWLFKCECGKEKIINGQHVKSGRIRSCGCLQKEVGKNLLIDITGQKFGRLTAIKPSERYNTGSKYWICKCDCGNPKPIVVRSVNLRRGNSKSCGCWHLYVVTELAKRGPDHHWYIGAIRDKRCFPGYEEWIKFIKKRDEYICQCCFISRKPLHAHHIQNYKDNPSLRTDPNNGITLCSLCHTNFHKKYGKIRNDQEQLTTFIKEYTQNVTDNNLQ